jgi:hypothetical protein
MSSSGNRRALTYVNEVRHVRVTRGDKAGERACVLSVRGLTRCVMMGKSVPWCAACVRLALNCAAICLETGPNHETTVTETHTLKMVT